MKTVKDNKWPEHMWDIYKISKAERGMFINNWFQGEKIFGKKKDQRNTLVRSELWTLIKVDLETSYHLYQHKYNPLSMTILCPTGMKFKYNNGWPLYEMKVQIHSIDDSSFGIWIFDKTIEELEKIQDKLANQIKLWMAFKKCVNGEEFLDYCVSIGFDNDQRDYN